MAQIQTLQLGLSGAEQDLPSKSRLNEGYQNEAIQLSGRSADGTLRTDFVARKKEWSVSWTVLSEADIELIEAIVDLQYTHNTFLSFIYSKEDGSTESATVQATFSGGGTLAPLDTFYFTGGALTLVEA